MGQEHLWGFIVSAAFGISMTQVTVMRRKLALTLKECEAEDLWLKVSWCSMASLSWVFASSAVYRHLSGMGRKTGSEPLLAVGPRARCAKDSQSCHQIETKSPKYVIVDTLTGIRVFRELQTRELKKKKGDICEIRRMIKFCLYKYLMFNTSIRDFHGTKFSYFLRRTLKVKNISMTRSETENKHINLL